jgi:hypothetical protein
MADYHFHVKRIKRSAGKSVVAAAAYRAGETLKDDYYNMTHDYSKKAVVKSGIFLPAHAPPRLQNRETLWNEVEKIEKHPAAQLAYSFDFSLQNEFTMEENIQLAQRFIREQFVTRGMICDYAIHNPHRDDEVPNPHVHVLCPIRPLTEHGEWGNKRRRAYTLDEDGNRIRDDNGDYVFSGEYVTDWDRPETLEQWRQAWADMCNQKFQEKHLPQQIDHRSFVRQGVEQIPTIHEGPAVREMEKRGLRTRVGDFNRWVRATNQMLRKVKAKLQELGALLQEIREQRKKLTSPDLAELLGQYYIQRNARAYSKKARANNLKRYAEDVSFLQTMHIGSVDRLQEYVSTVSGQVHDLTTALRSTGQRMKELDNLLRLAEDYLRLRPIVEAIPAKGGFGKKREKYMTAHDSEIRQYYAVKRKLDSALPDKKLTSKAWQEELDQLRPAYAADSTQLKAVYADLKKLRDIQYKINIAAHEQNRGQEHNKNRDAEL